MPHLIIEASSKTLFVDPDALLLALNRNLLESQEFEAYDIKSRLYIADISFIGITKEIHHFISLTLKIMPGRSIETQQKLMDGLIKTVEQQLIGNFPQETEITVEILELNALQYRKFRS